MKKENEGIFLVLLGAIAFSLGGLFVKLIPWSAISTNAGRCIFSSLMIYTYCRISGHQIVVNKTVLMGAVFVASMLLCYVASMKMTSAASAIVLEYTAPIFIIIFEALFFHKKAGKMDLLVCIIVLAGIILVVSGGSKSSTFIGDMVALLSGIFYAFVIMLNDFKDGDSLSSVLFGHMLTVLIGIPFILKETDFSMHTLMLVAALGIFQAGAGYTLMTVGLRHCDPLPGSLVASIEPVLNPILVAVFYGEQIGTRALIGAVIVIVSICVYNILMMKKERV